MPEDRLSKAATASGGKKPDGTNGFSTRYMWHCLKQRVRLNTPGKADGMITVWFDGAEVLDEQKVRFRTVAGLKIEGILFSTFFGGDDPSWATPADSVIEFRDFALSSKYIGK